MNAPNSEFRVYRVYRAHRAYRVYRIFIGFRVVELSEGFIGLSGLQRSFRGPFLASFSSYCEVLLKDFRRFYYPKGPKDLIIIYLGYG